MNKVKIESTYNKEGYLVKKTINNIPVFIPKELAPQIQIVDIDTAWVIEQTFMTEKEFKEKFKNCEECLGKYKSNLKNNKTKK